MSLATCISSILGIVFSLRLTLTSLPVTIIGHLKKNPSDTSAYTHKVFVFVKGDNKILAKAITDSKGDFTITFTPGKEKSFDFYCTGMGIDTLLISSVTRFESDTPEMVFYIPGLRKKNTLGKVICPRCKKGDKVYRIVYSDGTPDRYNNGKTTHEQTNNSKIIAGSYYAGSCIVEVAKFYCDRDTVKF